MASNAPGRLGSKALSHELRKLASTAHTITDDGTLISKEEALAEIVWNLALGWTEKITGSDAITREVKHPPVGWAIQYIYERLEGRAPQAVPDEHVGMKAVDKVRSLARDRLNELVKAGAPPTHVPKGTT